MKWFFISRLTNNVKIFIPFMTFLLRVKDPFIKKLINQFLLRKKKEESTLLNDSQLSDVEIFDDDFVINNQIKQIRRGIARTMVKGIHDYYS